MYLKEVEVTDNDILDEYNNDCIKNNFNPWLDPDRFESKIKEWEEDYKNDSKVHFYPFWLMNDNKVVGLSIIKTNIEVDHMWKEHGGNISYVIIPSERKKGYGTLCLHLALEKCKELGLENILITCVTKNETSKKIIENNYGILKDCIYDKYINSEEYRFTININESLKKYSQK